VSLHEKIINSLNNPDKKLIGQIIISDDEYNELLIYAHRRVSDLFFETIVPADPMLSVTLVQIAIRCYAEGNYWTYFKEEIDLDVSTSKANYVGQIFIATLNRYRLFQIEREQGTKYAYVENIKAHAFVPNNYLDSYFDFLFAFYDHNILRQLPENIEDVFSEMSDFFSSTLNDSGEHFSLAKFENKPAKSYKLLKATRTLFAQGDIVALSEEVYRHLQIIDKYYYDDVIPGDHERFGEVFSEWVKISTEINDNRHKREKRRSGVFYHKPYFSVNRTLETTSLIIPEQKIRNEDFNGAAYAIVSVDGDKKKFRLSMYRAFGVLVSEQLKIPVDNLFSHIEVIIKSDTEKLFEIPESDYRIFDTEFVELPKLHAGNNYFLVKKTTEVRGKEAVYTKDVHPRWNEYSFSDVDEKTVIYINNYPISMRASFIEGANFSYVSKEYTLLNQDKEIQTAYKHPSISFKVTKESLDGSFLWCNKNRFKITAIASSIFEQPDGINNYDVTILLNNILDYTAGLYRIYIDEPKKQHREICRYVFLPDLRCQPEKARFIFASDAVVTIFGNYDIKPINAIQIEEGSQEYLVDLSDGTEFADFSLLLDNYDYTLRVPLQIFRHGFEGNLQYSRPEYLWHTKLKNDLYISMPGATEAKVYISSKGVEKTAIGKVLGNGVFRFDISDIVAYIRKSTKAYNYISIMYLDNKWRKLSLYRVLNRLYVNKYLTAEAYMLMLPTKVIVNL
jgi:hypothetical protein